MRIAILLYSFPAPSQTFILNQITGLIDRGHEVTIFAERRSEHGVTDPRFEVYRLEERAHIVDAIPENYALRLLKALYFFVRYVWKSPKVLLRSVNFFKLGRHALNLRLFYHAITTLKRSDYDIIHCHFGPSGEMGARLRKVGALNGLLVTTFYGYDLYQESCLSKYDHYAFLFEVGELYIAISETMRSRLESLGCPPDRIIIHPLAIHLGRFASNQRITAKPDSITIVTIGRFVPKKGIECSVRAVARLIDVGRNVRYTIIGDGFLTPQITQLVQELGIQNYVHLLGWASQARVIEELQRADILLAASVTAANGDQEGTPMVILEAMATGIPVVSTYHSGIPEIVEDGVSGLLVPEGDVTALTAALTRLIQRPDLRIKMGRAGRKYVEARHDGRLLIQRLERIYMDQLINEDVRGSGDEMNE